VPSIARQIIVSRTPIQNIIALQTNQQVIAVKTINHIAAVAASQDVVIGRTADSIRIAVVLLCKGWRKLRRLSLQHC
jgi:hypothetical protein